jgi:phage terminase large subunit-like protein
LKQQKEASQGNKFWNPVDVADWVETHFYIPELKGPIILGEYQRRCLREALRKDTDGNFVYSTIVWSDIKKSAKSTIAGAVADYIAWHTTWGNLYLVANDLQQADSRVGYYARRGVELHPDMRNAVKIRPSGYYMEFPNRTFLRSIPIDPSGEAGSNPDMICYSELWGAHEDAQERMWVEMTLSPTKIGKSFRWVETYAGYSGVSSLLERLYEVGVREGRQLWPEPYPVNDGESAPIEAYANEAAGQFTLWNTKPRLPWQTAAYYAEESAHLPQSEFLRIHHNQWAQPDSESIPVSQWDACSDVDIPPIKPGDKTPLVVGLDASVSRDCTALVATSRHPMRHEDIAVRLVEVFVPPRGGTLDYDNTIAPVLKRWREDYNVIQLTYDDYQMHYFTDILRREHSVWVKKFSQAGPREVADKQLYDMVMGRRIHHDGTNRTLRQHILNTAVQITGDRMRFEKRSKTGGAPPIDAVVALSMSAYETNRLNL